MPNQNAKQLGVVIARLALNCIYMCECSSNECENQSTLQNGQDDSNISDDITETDNESDGEI